MAINYALRFMGKDQYVRIPYNDKFPQGNKGDFTIEFRAKVYSHKAYSHNPFFVRRNSAGNWDFFYTQGCLNNGIYQPLISIFYNNNNNWSQYGPPLMLGQWYHVAFVYGKSTGTTSVYLNGVLIGTLTSTRGAYQDTQGDYFIGASPTGEWLDGEIDELRIWTVARSQLNIWSDMNRQLTGDEEGLLAYYKFDEGEGNILRDSTSNGFHGTISGCKWVISDNMINASIAIPNQNGNIDKSKDYPFPFTVTPPIEGKKVYMVETNDRGTIGTRKLTTYPFKKSVVDFLNKMEVR